MTLGAILAGGALALACGGDSSGPVTPRRLVADAGDKQSGLTETQLTTPLRVRLTGSNGKAFAGAPVTWTVTAGDATLGAVALVTDNTGLASATVTLGVAPGSVAVRAEVASVPPVTFTATACDYPPLTLGTPIAGALSTTDCRFSGYYTDFYSLDLTSGQQEITISDSSNAFDTYVELYLFPRGFVGFNDDIDPNVIPHSRLDAIVVPGNYLVAPSSFDTSVTGPYKVSVATRALGLANCDLVWVMRGVVVSDSITTNDCGSVVLGYYDLVGIYAQGGSVLTITERSTAVDSRLRLLNSSGSQIAANDDSAAGNSNAFLVFPAPQTSVYYLQVGTAAATSGTTGAYTLEVSGSTTAAASEPLLPSPLRFVKPGPLPRSRRVR